MMRTRFLAAATAAFLALGMSVGGAGAAFATPPAAPTVPAGVTITYDNGTPCNSVGYTKPASLDNINGGTGSATFDWGSLSWSGGTVSWTVNPGWTVDLCVKGGNTWPLAEIDLGVYVGSTYTHPQGISHLGYSATFTAPVATAAITTTPRDCDTATTWNLAGASITNATWGSPVISGSTISITATATGAALFAAGDGVSGDRKSKTFTAAYEEAGGENCVQPPVATASVSVEPRNCYVATSIVINEGASSNVTWGDPVISGGTISITATATGDALFEEGLSGVSDDRTQRTFSATYEEAGGDDCVLPSIDVTAAMTPLTCEPNTGSFTAGLFDPSDPNADKLLWTTTEGTVPSASANPVSGPGTVTVTVRVADAHLGDYAVNDTSGLGVVSTIMVGDVETALITFTFTFTEAQDCELDAVVVPAVTYSDECVGEGRDAVQVAEFTVTRADNVSYSYSVNGGDPVDVVFPDGEETVTVAVAPLDEVVVTAVAADGFRLPDDYEPWSHSFIGAAFCLDTFPTTEAAAEITPPDCLGNPGRISLTNGLGVIWTLNGTVVAGNTTHTVPAGTAVTLVASLEGPSDEYPGGFGWNDEDQQTEWNAVMEVDPQSGGEECLLDEDELPTLAFTGANGLTTSLGIFAVIAMLVGMGFVARRHQVTA
jgi:hypothetical protein